MKEALAGITITHFLGIMKITSVFLVRLALFRRWI